MHKKYDKIFCKFNKFQKKKKNNIILNFYFGKLIFYGYLNIFCKWLERDKHLI